MNKNVRIGLLLLIVTALIGIPQASAIPRLLGEFNSTYGTQGTRIDTCLVCHNYPDPYASRNSSLNPYGLDVHEVWTDWFTPPEFHSIDNIDSDGDGFRNGAEINQLYFPGNITDHPPSSTIMGLISCERCSQFQNTRWIRLRGVDLVTGNEIDKRVKTAVGKYYKFYNINEGFYILYLESQSKLWWDNNNPDPVFFKVPSEYNVFKIDFNIGEFKEN